MSERHPFSSDLPYLLLDANCIIYYCFNFQELLKGIPIPIRHRLTDRVVSRVQAIINRGQRVGTLEAIVQEIHEKGAEAIVYDYLEDREWLRPFLDKGLIISPQMVERWQNKLQRKIRELLLHPWFICCPFDLPDEDLESIRAFYRERADAPEMLEYLKSRQRTDPIPSREDMMLLRFSGLHSIPLLTNDHHILLFANGLTKSRLCFQVIAP